MFLISGITGHVGGATAKGLLAAGRQVRALVRDPAKAAAWAKQGVELHRGDFDDPTTLSAALAGVEGAFLMIPPTLNPGPNYEVTKGTIASFTRALEQAPPPRLVALSSFGSQRTKGIGLITSTHLMETALAGMPFPVAFVRPGSFLENYTYAVPQAAATGAFDIFLDPTNRPVPMTATADIGAEVAKLLAGPGWSGTKVVELGTRHSPDELARALGEVLGRPVQARAVPRPNWAAALQHMGMPPGSTGPYEEMMDGVNSGWIDFGVPGAEAVPGSTTPTQFFAANQPR